MKQDRAAADLSHRESSPTLTHTLRWSHALILAAGVACSSSNNDGPVGGGGGGESAASGGGRQGVGGVGAAGAAPNGGAATGGNTATSGVAGASGGARALGGAAGGGTPLGGGSGGAGGTGGSTAPVRFVKRVVTQGLGGPWEILWGPDQRLWITERTGKRVLRMDPQTGSITPAVTISEVQFSGTQDGLLGMALHPRLLAGSNYVYLAYTYGSVPGVTELASRRTKIVRFSFDAQTGALSQPLELLKNLPASTDHNSGRLIIGPDEKIYYTIGDQGANQFEHKCETIRAQDLPSAAEVTAQDRSKYPGKILRLNLDGSIPDDNPTLAGAKSHIYTYGHRNAQGIVFAASGILYADEQGPKTDDEINRIVAGRNYGWPNVAGYKDDKAYVYGNWSASKTPACSTLTYSDYDIPASVPLRTESQGVPADFSPPLMTFYTVESSYNFHNPTCAANEFICWPTIAPSSLDFYPADPAGVPGWPNSLLLTSLKKGTVYRVSLSADLMSLAPGTPEVLFTTANRYRDIAINPNHRIFYVVTDSQGQAAGPGGGPTGDLENSGAVLEFSAALTP